MKAIISDEDSAICPAIDEFSGIFHILCAKHKISNISKIISSKHPKLNLYKELISKIVYSRCESIAIAALNELYKNFPEVIDYFENNVIPIKHKLFASLKPDVFIYNHSSSQLAESYNSMIKRDLTNSILHLFEIRQHVINKFAIKKNFEQQIREKSFIFHHFLLDEYKLSISKKVCQMIDEELRFIGKIEILDNDGQTWIAKEENQYFYLNFENCQCHIPIQAGIPCRHLMALYQCKNLLFPVHLINKRFYLNTMTQNPLNAFDYNFEEEEEHESDSEFFY